MSQKYPYTIRGDDFESHEDMYRDSYQRQSSMYQPSVRSLSQEQTRSTTFSNRTVDSRVQLPGALSFLYSCGLDSSDIAHLAEIPENLFTAERLSSLLSQIKERKLSSASTSSASSRPSTSQTYDTTLNRAWEGSTHTRSVEYPVDRPAHPVYPPPPKQGKTWQDCWENPRQRSGIRSSSSSVPDYNVYKNTNRDHRATGSTSRSFIGGRPKPLLSLKLEPPVVEPSRKESSDFHCKIPQDFPHVCRLCDISVRSTKDWFSHVRGKQHVKSQLDLLKKYPKWAQSVDFPGRNEILEVYKVPTKTEASDFNGIAPPVFPYLCVLCNITVFSEKDWSAHITGGQHAQSQLDLMAKYPDWDGTVQSSRRSDGHISTDIRDGTSRETTSDLKNERCSRVVSFTPLPVGEGIATELTAIAKRFGSVKKCLFLPNRGYVEMGCLAEARKLVEHFSANQLKIKGKLIQATYSCEYNSLREAEGDSKPRSHITHQRRSPSPRRRRSSERSRSSPKRKGSSDRNLSSTKRRRSSERTHSSGSPDIKDRDDSPKFKENDSTSIHPYPSSGSAAEATTTNNNKVESINLDSDLQRLEVGAKLAHEPTTSDQRNLSLEEMDVTDKYFKEEDVKTGDASPNDPSEAANSQKEDQKFKEQNDEESKEVRIRKTPAKANTSENAEDSVVQPKDEHHTKRVTDDLKKSDITIAPIESSSVVSSAGVCEKSQKSTKAPTPPTESVKQPEITTDALGPYEPNVPVGVEFVKMGYYCRVCQLFYSSEKAAKKVHCSSQAHYEKLKIYLEKTKAQCNRKKN